MGGWWRNRETGWVDICRQIRTSGIGCLHPEVYAFLVGDVQHKYQLRCEMRKASVLYVFTLAFVATPFHALATSICKKYESDLRFIAGDGDVVFTPYMSPNRGALDQTPSKEIGCEVNVKPSNRGVTLLILREREDGLTFGETVRAAYEIYKRSGIKEKLTAEPKLGSEGFSLLMFLAPGLIANHLRVLGHTDTKAVNVSVDRGSNSRSPFSQAEIDRAKDLANKVLSAE